MAIFHAVSKTDNIINDVMKIKRHIKYRRHLTIGQGDRVEWCARLPADVLLTKWVTTMANGHGGSPLQFRCSLCVCMCVRVCMCCVCLLLLQITGPQNNRAKTQRAHDSHRRQAKGAHGQPSNSSGNGQRQPLTMAQTRVTYRK